MIAISFVKCITLPSRTTPPYANWQIRKQITMLSRHLTVWLALLITDVVAAEKRSLPNGVLTSARRFLNFGSLFGSATYSRTPYERVAGHPVFSVTTPWGSPYMSMEKLSDLDEVVQENRAASSSTTPQSISEEQNEVRTVALYYMDPDDALAAHAEMKQLDSMQSADIRLTSLSLMRALRQATNFGNGLPTGAPPDALSGKFETSQGASLRYKIVPPKRQLYYAARCKGRERVGLQSETPAQDAQSAILGNSALEGLNLMRRRSKRERKGVSTAPPGAAHMEGYTGIPVFHCPALRKRHPIKGLVTGQRQETPLFFNYEDLEAAWSQLKQRQPKLKIPDKPENVEVFNMWDVLASMDKDAWNKKKNSVFWKPSAAAILSPLKRRFGKLDHPDLQDITFVPSSRAIDYKERISRRGNGKARLRPMR